MSKSTSQYTIQLDPVSIQVLDGIAEATGHSPEKLAAAIVRSHLSSYQPPSSQQNNTQRMSPRKPVNITGVINIPSDDNIQSYRSVIITDLSLGGLGGEFTETRDSLAEALRKAKAFEILFTLPGTKDLLSFECNLSHSRANGSCRFGGSFINPSGSSLHKLLELLASPCTTNELTSTKCRERQHLSVSPTDS